MSAQSAPPVSVTTPTSDTAPPSVPSGVTASASGPAAVLVTWTASTDNVGVAGYDVFRNGIILSTLSSTTLSLTDRGVTPGGNYSYTVDAFDAQGNHSAASSPAAVHVPAQIKFVQGKVATTGSRVTSMTLSLGAVAAGDLLVGWFAQYDAAGQVNVTDNLNGLWTRSSAATTWKGTAGDIALYYLANVSAAPGLTNVRQHSGATEANVVLTDTMDHLLAVITDNGRGIDLDESVPLGMGMLGMRERALFLGADLKVTSYPGAGTELTVAIPRRALA